VRGVDAGLIHHHPMPLDKEVSRTCHNDHHRPHPLRRLKRAKFSIIKVIPLAHNTFESLQALSRALRGNISKKQRQRSEKEKRFMTAGINATKTGFFSVNLKLFSREGEERERN
jgi:hypothetical protein